MPAVKWQHERMEGHAVMCQGITRSIEYVIQELAVGKVLLL